MRQTLAEVSAKSEQELQAFERCMLRWKAVGQTRARRARALRPAKPNARKFIGMVYRSDEASSRRNWSSELQLLPAKLASQREAFKRLQIEYLALAIADAQVFSLPAASDATLDKLSQLPIADRPSVFARGVDCGEFFFQILDKKAARKKVVRTAGCKHKHMAMGAMIQRIAVRQCGDAAGELVVYYDGCPETVDLLTLAKWPVWRSGLRRWSVAASGHPACLLLRDAVAPIVPSDWRDEQVPAIVLLEQLAAAGWTRGRRPAWHTRSSDKCFDVADPVKDRNYLRCLVGLGALFDADDAFVGLPSGQQCSFYDCVLAAPKPSAIPRDLKAADYRAILDRPSSSSGAAAVIDAGAADPPPEDVVVVAKPAFFGRSAGPRPPPRPPAPKRFQPSQPAPAQDWGVLVALPQPAPAPAAAASTQLPSQQAIQAAAPRAQAQAAAPSQLVAIDPAPPLPEAVAGEAGRAAQGAKAQRHLLEGVQVIEDAHGVIGQPRSYRRLKVCCPPPSWAIWQSN